MRGTVWHHLRRDLSSLQVAQLQTAPRAPVVDTCVGNRPLRGPDQFADKLALGGLLSKSLSWEETQHVAAICLRPAYYNGSVQRRWRRWRSTTPPIGLEQMRELTG
jgi:hypothetical protein